MTKEEAQAIIDEIDPTNVIDDNWLSYLIDDKEFKILKAIHVIFKMNYNQFLEEHEGDCISNFQTKKEIYVGKLIKVDGIYYLITSQDDKEAYYIIRTGYVKWFKLEDINKYLV